MYLEYHKETKRVVEIHETVPTVTSDYDYAISDSYNVGDEFEWTIWINEVDKDKRLVSYSAIRNNPNAKRLLEENEQLKKDNELLKAQNKATSERADFIENVIAEMAMQVYQ
ncbi:hypothetical protein [Lentibacillus sp. Marseille-P4043]|uniref:hypothetical protein n=1 Tax=Lentibacillus sp. Marseille-P4043 TaxID=2040293 RepID=UPI000D0B315F|nr:hypothetical protein [Lentibacillus sp. Marseille-P4043]